MLTIYFDTKNNILKLQEIMRSYLILYTSMCFIQLFLSSSAKVRVNNLKQKLRLAKSQLKTGNYLIRNLLLYNLLLLLLFLRSTCFTLIVNFLHQEELNRKKECDIKLKETCMPYRSSLSRFFYFPTVNLYTL
jgi:hypothetical protein